MTDAPEIRWTNRRRMAWVCLAAGLAVCAWALIRPPADGILWPVFTFLGTPLAVYMGGSAAVNWRHGR